MRKKTDTRKLGHKTLTAVRQRAVASVHEGHSPEIVVQTIGMRDHVGLVGQIP